LAPAEGLKKALLSHRDEITSIAISGNSRWAVTGDKKGVLCYWDLLKLSLVARLDQQTKWGAIYALAIAPDGMEAISAHHRGNLYVWDLRSHLSKGAPLLGHPMPDLADSTGGVTYLPEAARAISGNFDGTVRLWNLTTRKELLKTTFGKLHVLALALERDGKHVLAGLSDGSVRRLDVATLKEVRSFIHDENKMASTKVLSLDAGQNAEVALSGTNVGSMRLWQLDRGAVDHVLLQDKRQPPPAMIDVALSEDGQIAVSLAKVGANQNVQFWNVARSLLLRTLPNVNQSVTRLALSPDNRFCLTGGSKGQIYLWNTSEELGKAQEVVQLVRAENANEGRMREAPPQLGAPAGNPFMPMPLPGKFGPLPGLPGGPAGKLNPFDDERVLFFKQATFTNQDPLDRQFSASRCKIYNVSLKAGQVVSISMVGDNDPYLRLEDNASKLLTSDDDSGGGLNALIRGYRVQRTGNYRVVATTLRPGFGSFTLTVTNLGK
jgi:WD40 repeat protein